MKNNIIGRKSEQDTLAHIFESDSRNLWLYVDAAEWEKRFLCANILNRKWCFRHQDWLVETHRSS